MRAIGALSSLIRLVSAMVANISAPHPAVFHTPSTTITRLVFLALSRTIFLSKGFNVLKSITSALIPSFSKVCAAFNDSYTG